MSKNKISTSFNKHICPFCQGKIVFEQNTTANLYYCPICVVYNTRSVSSGYQYYLYISKNTNSKIFEIVYIRFDDLRLQVILDAQKATSNIFSKFSEEILIKLTDVKWNFSDIQSIYKKLKLLTLYV